jgi:alpha-1,6-mannosyltransferase
LARKVHLVDVSEFYSEFGGGVRTYVRQKLEASARAGVRTTIIAPGPSDRRETHAGGEIMYVRSPALPFDHRYWIFGDMRPVRALLDELDPDVVEASSSWQGARIVAGWRGAAAKALFLHQDPVAVYPHSLFSPPLSEARVDQLCFWFWGYLRRLAEKFDMTVSPGRRFAARLESFGVPNVEAAPLGVEREIFAQARPNAEMRRAMLGACGQTRDDALLFIAVSRHHPEKRLLMLIEAFSRFAAERPAALYVVGDGPMWRAIRARAEKTPNVCIAGPIGCRGDLAARLASADAFLHGGAAETFGLVVAEAISCGLPVIAPDTGGAAELSHPTYAENFRSGETASVVEAMRRFAARPRGDMVIAARAAASRLATPDDHFAKLFALYGSIAPAVSGRRVA